MRGARVSVFPDSACVGCCRSVFSFGVRGSIGSDGSQFTHLRCGPLRVGVVSCPWSARRVAVTRRYQHVYELLYALSLTVSMHNGVETGVDSRPGLFLYFHVSRFTWSHTLSQQSCRGEVWHARARGLATRIIRSGSFCFHHTNTHRSFNVTLCLSCLVSTNDHRTIFHGKVRSKAQRKSETTRLDLIPISFAVALRRAQMSRREARAVA